eukprot:6162069-Amphidinium_carterae.3
MDKGEPHGPRVRSTPAQPVLTANMSAPKLVVDSIVATMSCKETTKPTKSQRRKGRAHALRINAIEVFFNVHLSNEGGLPMVTTIDAEA